MFYSKCEERSVYIINWIYQNNDDGGISHCPGSGIYSENGINITCSVSCLDTYGRLEIHSDPYNLCVRGNKCYTYGAINDLNMPGALLYFLLCLIIFFSLCFVLIIITILIISLFLKISNYKFDVEETINPMVNSNNTNMV